MAGIGARLRAAGQALTAGEEYWAGQRAGQDAAVVGREYAERARSYPGVVRASGMRIDAETSQDTLRALAGARQKWQPLAWGYRKLIGELRFALRFRANSIARVEMFVAEVDPRKPKQEPIPLDLRHDEDPERSKRVTIPDDLATAAENELARLPLGAGYEFLGVWSENFDVAGECWLHGRVHEDGTEEWRIRSVREIEISGRNVQIKEPELAGQMRKIDFAREELYRLYVPDPEEGHLPDSPLRSLLDTLEDIVLAGREKRAVRRSRIASNGILKIPRNLTLVRNVQADDDTGDTRSSDGSKFMADFSEAVISPINNEGDPSAVVPIGIVGEVADLEGFTHMSIERTATEHLQGDLEADLRRMANGLDIPPEIITGMADANHWTAWQIDTATAKHHIEPGVRLMVDSITTAFLRASLLRQGFSPADVAKVRVWYSLSDLTENVNRRQDALDAYDRLVIGPAALADALGFAPGDAPSPQEMITAIAAKQGVDAATAAAILHWYVGRESENADDVPPIALPAGARVGGPGSNAIPGTSRRNTTPGPGESSGGTPAPPGGVVASGPPRDVLSGKTSRTLHSGVCPCGGYLDAQGRCSMRASTHDALLALNHFTASAVTAAVEPDMPEYRLEFDRARQLMDVDRALRDRILTASDAAVARALERGGNRLRSKTTADRELNNRVRGMTPLELCQFVGKTQALALGADDEYLLADAFTDLAGRFRTWTVNAITDVVGRVLKMLGLHPDTHAGSAARQRMTHDLNSRLDQGWSWLHQELLTITRKALFGQPTETADGEPVEGRVPPSVVRGALAVIGGLPETSGGMDEKGRSLTGEPVGGLSNGDTVRRELEQHGAVEVGYLWVYGITPASRKFDPHWDLEGERFANWTDPKLDTSTTHDGKYQWVGPYFAPGDHGGCMCDYVPAWAVPAYAEQVRDRLSVPTANMVDILTLAAGDDRAGRTGTDAQEQRARWQHIQTLQSRFLDGGQ